MKPSVKVHDYLLYLIKLRIITVLLSLDQVGTKMLA